MGWMCIYRGIDHEQLETLLIVKLVEFVYHLEDLPIQKGLPLPATKALWGYQVLKKPPCNSQIILPIYATDLLPYRHRYACISHQHQWTSVNTLQATLKIRNS